MRTLGAWVLLLVPACNMQQGGVQPPPPEPEQVTLTVVRAGTGAGTVASVDDAAIACGATCSVTLDEGTVLVLRAAPAFDSTFEGFAGCDAVQGSDCTVALEAHRTVTAIFDRAVVVDPEPDVARITVASTTCTGAATGSTCTATLAIEGDPRTWGGAMLDLDHPGYHVTDLAIHDMSGTCLAAFGPRTIDVVCADPFLAPTTLAIVTLVRDGGPEGKIAVAEAAMLPFEGGIGVVEGDAP